MGRLIFRRGRGAFSRFVVTCVRSFYPFLSLSLCRSSSLRSSARPRPNDVQIMNPLARLVRSGPLSRVGPGSSIIRAHVFPRREPATMQKSIDAAAQSVLLHKYMHTTRTVLRIFSEFFFCPLSGERKITSF